MLSLAIDILTKYQTDLVEGTLNSGYVYLESAVDTFADKFLLAYTKKK